MDRQPETYVKVLMEGYRKGLVSRRRMMALAAKLPAVAATLAAAGQLSAGRAAPGASGRLGRSSRQEPVTGGTLSMSYPQTVSDTLNQHRSNHTTSRMVARHVLDNLTWVNPADGSVNPWLAESWTISDDGLEYTFNLKQGVVFQDGAPFNAQAVVRNFEETMDPEQRTGFAYQALGGTAYNRAEAVDDVTLKVYFNQPHAAFLLYLSDGGTGIDSPAALDEYGVDYGVIALVGSGPFSFVEWFKDDHLTLRKNPDYTWGPAAFGQTGPAYLDEIIFRDVPEASVRAQAVAAGEIDMARIIEPNVAELEGFDNVEIIATPKAGTCRMFLMNVGTPPTDDIRVRRALNMALDKATMLQLPGWAGFGRPGIAPLPSNMVPGGDLSSLAQYDIPYDPDGARTLLEEAGWVLNGDIREKDGQQLVLDMVTTQADVDAGQIEPLDGFFNEVGARLNIMAGDFNYWIDLYQKGEYDITLMSDSGFVPGGLIEEFFRGGEPFAVAGMNVESVNVAIDAAVASPNLDDLWEHLFEAMALIMQEVSGIMAWEQDYLDVASTSVHGLAFNEVGFGWYYGTWKDS